MTTMNMSNIYKMLITLDKKDICRKYQCYIGLQTDPY